MKPDQRVLFVCLGNICRSPAAEGVFRHQLSQAGLADRVLVDSAGTGGWHVGKRADPRMRAAAARRGLELTSRARQLEPDDLNRFDRILTMDDDNLAAVQAMAAPGNRHGRRPAGGGGAPAALQPPLQPPGGTRSVLRRREGLRAGS